MTRVNRAWPEPLGGLAHRGDFDSANSPLWTASRCRLCQRGHGPSEACDAMITMPLPAPRCSTRRRRTMHWQRRGKPPCLPAWRGKPRRGSPISARRRREGFGSAPSTSRDNRRGWAFCSDTVTPLVACPSTGQGRAPSRARKRGGTVQKKILVVNGVPTMVVADGDSSLADVLREQLGLTGTKVGCGQGQCGCCSVILDGKVVRSCVTKYRRLNDWTELTTVEGIGTPLHPHALQVAWMVHGGAQCGFCSPGFIVSAKALSTKTPALSCEDTRLVPAPPQCLSVYRLSATSRRRRGRRQGAARRDDSSRTWSSRSRRTGGSGTRSIRGPPAWERSPAPSTTGRHP